MRPWLLYDDDLTTDDRPQAACLAPLGSLSPRAPEWPPGVSGNGGRLNFTATRTGSDAHWSSAMSWCLGDAQVHSLCGADVPACTGPSSEPLAVLPAGRSRRLLGPCRRLDKSSLSLAHRCWRRPVLRRVSVRHCAALDIARAPLPRHLVPLRSCASQRVPVKSLVQTAPSARPAGVNEVSTQ